MKKKVFPAEWQPQDFVQLTWPDHTTDWSENLDKVHECYLTIAKEITKYQHLLVVTRDVVETKAALADLPKDKISYVEAEINDTWARDHGGITVFIDGTPAIRDFQFNGWGNKFDATQDNLITSKIVKSGELGGSFDYINDDDFVLEGGSIESDGMGTILTTSACLLNPNRNQRHSKQEVETVLNERLGAERILWLDYGYLEGDDTDSHIDTLARFCDSTTIAYVRCQDPQDTHYEPLKAMEAQLKTFRTVHGEPYTLIPLPMSSAVFHEGKRLPATYANFLIINEAVLVPIYNLPTDNDALKTLKSVYADREVIGIDCRVLIHEHGSLHCITMQYPKGVLK